MKNLQNRGISQFYWIQTGELELKLIAPDNQSDPFAVLRWAKRWGSLATGESADRYWSFKRVGFLRPRITIREAGSDSNVAVFSYQSLKGTVDFPLELQLMFWRKRESPNHPGS
jgi:hypothetical protein